MKTCEEYAALLDMYVDGFCTDEESAQVRKHLAECENCRMYVAQILQMKEAFPDAEETEVPAGFADGVMEVIRAETARQKKGMKPWQKTLLQMAACMALVIALGPLSEVLTGGRGGEAEISGSQVSYAPQAPAAYSAGDNGKSSLLDQVEESVTGTVDDSALPMKPSAPMAPAVPTPPASTPSAPAPGAKAEEPQDSAAGKLKVELTRTQMEEILGRYTGTPWGEAVVYELTGEDMDVVLGKIPLGNVIPGTDMDSIRGKNCILIVYPTE